MAAVEAIGLVSGVIGIVQFAAGWLPEPPTQPATTFHIWCGVEGTTAPDAPEGDDGLQASGGGFATNGIRLWNSVGEQIGSGGGTEYFYSDTEIQVTQSIKEQAVTVDFVANSDALCIARITSTLHEGTQFGWTGDWGKICGLDWYYSGQYVESGTEPFCTWIDKDHTNGFKAGVIAMNWPAFARHDGEEAPNTDGTEFCGVKEGIRAWRDDGDGQQILVPGQTIASNRVNGRDGDNAGKHLWDDRLIISSRESHSATELCESPTSFGPDFLSLVEGVYCDMETRVLLPICAASQGSMEEEEEEADCFDLEAVYAGTSSGVSSIAGASRLPRSKVIEW